MLLFDELFDHWLCLEPWMFDIPDAMICSFCAGSEKRDGADIIEGGFIDCIGMKAHGEKIVRPVASKPPRT